MLKMLHVTICVPFGGDSAVCGGSFLVRLGIVPIFLVWDVSFGIIDVSDCLQGSLLYKKNPLANEC